MTLEDTARKIVRKLRGWSAKDVREDARKFFESTAMSKEVRERLAKFGLYRMPSD